MSYFKNWTPKENNYITELIIKVPVYFNHMHFVIFTETIAQIMLGDGGWWGKMLKFPFDWLVEPYF